MKAIDWDRPIRRVSTQLECRSPAAAALVGGVRVVSWVNAVTGAQWAAAVDDFGRTMQTFGTHNSHIDGLQYQGVPAGGQLIENVPQTLEERLAVVEKALHIK